MLEAAPNLPKENPGIDGEAAEIAGSPYQAAQLVFEDFESFYIEQKRYQQETARLSLRNVLISGQEEEPVEPIRLASFTSFVEKSDSVFGYALAMHKPDPEPGTMFTAEYYTVSLKESDSRVLIEEPTSISVKSGLQRHEWRDEIKHLAETVPKEDLERIHAMAEKALLSLRGERQPLNANVWCKLCEANVDDLAVLFPAESLPKVENVPTNIYEADVWRKLRQRLRKDVDRKRRGDAAVALQSMLGGTTYTIHVESKRGLGERVPTYLRVLCQRENVPSTTIDTPLDGENWPEKELNELEKDVDAVFKAIDSGKPISTDAFKLLWKHPDTYLLRRL